MLVMPSDPITRQYRLDTFLPRSILYADSVIAHDPLHSWFYRNNPRDIGNYFKLSVPDKRNRLCKYLWRLIYLKPLVESRIVLLVPILAIDELIKKQLSELTSQFMAKAQFLEACEESLVVEKRGPKVRFYLYPPDKFWGHTSTIPGRGDIERYKTEYFKTHAEWLIRDTLRGEILGAGPCAINPGEWRLLRIIASENANERSLAAASMLELELPWLDRLPIENIISIREDEEIFEVFRQNVEHFFSHASSVRTKDDFRRQVERMKREIIVPSLSRIDRRLRRLDRDYFLGAVGSVTSVGVSIATGSWVAAIPALAPLYATVSTLLGSPVGLEREPAYFLWKLQHG